MRVLQMFYDSLKCVLEWSEAVLEVQYAYKQSYGPVSFQQLCYKNEICSTLLSGVPGLVLPTRCTVGVPGDETGVVEGE